MWGFFQETEVALTELTINPTTTPEAGASVEGMTHVHTAGRVSV